MATASAKAIANIIDDCILDAASGLRPMASMAFEPIKPIAIAGPKVPIAITAAIAMNLKTSFSIINFARHPK